MPEQLTLGQLTQFAHAQIAQHGPALFARAMQHQLGSRERLTSLDSMLGATGDARLHVLLQLQCDQLRQYCAQMLEAAASGASQT